MKMEKLCVIADDLTGATDTGVQFSKYGLSTLVIFNHNMIMEMRNDSEVIVVNAETRKLDAENAYRQVREITKLLQSLGVKKIYKKVDSTLRGNPAKELEAILDEMGRDLAFLVPSYPANGRIVEGGYLYLSKSSPEGITKLFPVGYIPEMIERELTKSVAMIGLEDVRKGAARIKQKINELKSAGRQVLVIDAVTEEDLNNIALAIKDMAETSVVAGSAGLAAHLPQSFDLTVQSYRANANEGSVLFMAGTCNPVTAEQINQLHREENVYLITISSEEIIAGNAAEEIERVVAEAADRLRAGAVTIVAIDTLLQSREETYHNLNLALSDSQRIAESFGKIADKLAAQRLLRGLVLTGGDTALHVVDRLGAVGMILEDEVLPGIPCGSLIGGKCPGLKIITKAGGFGNQDSFVDIYKFITKAKGKSQ